MTNRRFLLMLVALAAAASVPAPAAYREKNVQ
jgi:hypothetical protein